MIHHKTINNSKYIYFAFQYQKLKVTKHQYDILMYAGRGVRHTVLLLSCFDNSKTLYSPPCLQLLSNICMSRALKNQPLAQEISILNMISIKNIRNWICNYNDDMILLWRQKPFYSSNFKVAWIRNQVCFYFQFSELILNWLLLSLTSIAQVIFCTMF